MSNTFLSLTSLRSAPFPSFRAGRIGITLLLLQFLAGAAFLGHGSGKTGELRVFAQELGDPAALAAACGQLIGAILLIVAPLGSALIAWTGAVATTRAKALTAKGKRFTAALLICLAGGSLYAQTEAAEESRAAEIIAERQAKAGRLAPEDNSGLERQLLFLKENRILERITGGIGGVRLKLGGLATNGGFALGPEYLRYNRTGHLQFRVAAVGSTKLFQKYDTEFTLSRFGRERLFLNFYAVHHNYPELEYYGPGPDSAKTGRSNYRLEDTAVDGNVGFRLLPHLSLVASTGYVWNNVGPGTASNLISTELQFPPAQAPGIDHQADFLRYGAFLQLDYRDRPGRAQTWRQLLCPVQPLRRQNPRPA